MERTERSRTVPLRCRWFYLLLLLTHAISAQELVTQPLPFVRQLFTNEVYHVHQDSEGYLWMGTTSSLQRWDGQRLLTFRSDSRHPNLLADNSIKKIADTSALLWIVSETGLTLYDKSNGRFFQPTDQRVAHSRIDGIDNDGNDGIWIAIGKQLLHCNAACTKVETIDPFAGMAKSHDISDIYIDKQNWLWVLCRDGALLRGRENVFEQLPSIPKGGVACTIFQDAEGRYWVGTWGQGLWQYVPNSTDGNVWQEQHVTNTETGRDEGIFFCICQDKSKGWLWMLSYNKLYVLKTNDGKLETVDVSAHISPHHYYTSMICDREGNIWLTAYDGGYIVSFDDSGMQAFSIYDPTDASEQLLNLLADDDYVWLNRQRNGLHLMDRKSRQLTSINIGLPELATLRPARSPHNVWVAQRYYSTAYRLQRKGAKVTKEETIDLEKVLTNSRPIKDMTETPQGTLWLLTQHHLVARSLQPDAALFTADLTDPTAFTLLDNSEEVLCVANRQLMNCTVQERRVACREVAKLDFLLDNEEVIALTTEPKGHVWLATTLGRTFRSDSLMQNFLPSPIDSLLCNGLVQDMLAYRTSIWVMNDKRIVCYDIATGSITSYDAAKGAIKIEGFCHHALCHDTDGVLAGGMGGFLHLPSHIKNSSLSTPGVHPTISDATIGGKSIFFGPETNASTFSHIVIPAHAHHFELCLSTLTYSPTKTPRIQYRMQGAEKHWTEIDPVLSTAHYSSLPRGTFAFQIRLMQDYGTWSEPITVATVEREPAWYESTQAFIVYLLTLIVSLLIIIRMVKRRHARKLQSEVTQAKMAIITANHRLTDEMVKIVDAHLGESDFTLEQLLTEIGMSKSTLYRQLKAETDMSPSDLIRSIRMKRASEMLLTRKMTVSEVAYATGFSTPKYFTRCFKEEFGQTPSAYVQTHTTPTTSEETMR